MVSTHFDSARFEQLKQAGAATQRVLWASTGTKNPNYSDILYVDSLIGPDTVNTIPPATYDAYKLHGRPRATLLENRQQAHEVFAAFKDTDIDINAVTQQLEEEGVKSFAKSFDNLLAVISNKIAMLQRRGVRAAG